MPHELKDFRLSEIDIESFIKTMLEMQRFFAVYFLDYEIEHAIYKMGYKPTYKDMHCIFIPFLLEFGIMNKKEGVYYLTA